MSEHSAEKDTGSESDAGRVTGVELHCDDCQQPYGVWFAENAVWNLVMGGPEAKGDPGGMLCPRCFTVRAEVVSQQTAIWRLVLDNATRVTLAGGDTAPETTDAFCAECLSLMVEDNGAGHLCPVCDDHLSSECEGGFPCSGFDGKPCVLNTPLGTRFLPPGVGA